MRPRTATLAAVLLAVAVYVGLAWLARGIDIPSGVPTASLSWISPYRVVATTGFLIASSVGAPHLAGDFVSVVLLGAILGAVFALARKALGG